MSQFRHRWRVVVDGRELEVTTSARDMAALTIDLNGDQAMMDPTQVMRMIHAALIRTEVADIPNDVDAFLDLLDDMDDLEPGEGESVDPTPRPALGA
jgi:hypothetical protein